VPRATVIFVVKIPRTMPRDVAGGGVVEARGIRLDVVGRGGRNHAVIIVVAIIGRSSLDNVAIAVARRDHAVVIVVAVVGGISGCADWWIGRGARRRPTGGI